jgi:hypothetical protein
MATIMPELRIQPDRAKQRAANLDAAFALYRDSDRSEIRTTPRTRHSAR